MAADRGDDPLMNLYANYLYKKGQIDEAFN